MVFVHELVHAARLMKGLAGRAERVMRFATQHRPSLAWMLLLGALLALHAAYYWPFFSDDALISLRYGQRLAEGHGLTWTDGERVEGYTDLLWVLFAAAAHLVRIDLIWAARILDFAGALAAIGFVSLEASGRRIAPLRAISAGLALALCAPLAVWAIGGLEHGFMTGVLAAALVVLRDAWEQDRPPMRRLLLAGALLGVLCLSRADGMVLAVTCVAGLLVTRKPSLTTLRAVALVSSIPLVLLAIQLAFRLAYYGEWVPNTALVKVSFNTHRLMEGLHHVRDGLKPLLPMLGLVLAAVAVSVRALPTVRWALPLTVAVGWSSYVVVVGGDIFPGWRQLLLGIIPFAMVIAEGAQAVGQRWPRRSFAVPLAALPVLGTGLWLQTKNPENIRADDEMWEWDGYAIGPVLGIAFGDKAPLLAVDAAGALPYWSRLPSLDMLGLNDKHIATHPPPGFGTLGIGHELGDGAYVLKRRPDIIAFNNAAGARTPRFLSGRHMVATPEFKTSYQLVRVKGARMHRPVGEIWFRREDSVLGVQRSQDRLDVPGYFFAGGNAVAILHDRSLVTEVTPDATATLPTLQVPPGTWRLDLNPPNQELETGARCGKVSAIPTGVRGPLILEVTDQRPIDLVLGTRAAGSKLVASATLTRTEDSPTHRCGPRSGALVVPIQALPDIQPERGDWAYPTNIVLSKAGVQIRLAKQHNVPALHLSVDNNDVMRIEFSLHGQVVGRTEVQSKPGIAGMASHRVTVPDDARESTFDAIAIVPVKGDGNYSLGHLVLLAE
jgi:hypothetical protein